MGVVGNSLTIPNFLSAASPQGLRRLCLANNLKYGKQFAYKDFSFANGKWYCWYEYSLTIQDANLEITNK